LLGVATLAGCSHHDPTENANSEIRRLLAEKQFVDLIVEFHDSTASPTAGTASGTNSSDAALRKAIYAAQKVALLKTLSAKDFEVLQQYEALPLIAIRIRNVAAFDHVRAFQAVKRVYPDRVERLTKGSEKSNWSEEMSGA